MAVQYRKQSLHPCDCTDNSKIMYSQQNINAIHGQIYVT